MLRTMTGVGGIRKSMTESSTAADLQFAMVTIGRVLLNRPLVVFLDEVSSALDEGLEDAMYRLLREASPNATLVSVGHRSSLLGRHTKVLELLGEGKWRLRKTMSPVPAARS
jgi:ABC-type uncharacterized transport system fused permease/ATPase subunit